MSLYIACGENIHYERSFPVLHVPRGYHEVVEMWLSGKR